MFEMSWKSLAVCLTIWFSFGLPALGASYTGGGSDPTDWSDNANWTADPTNDTANIQGAYTVIVATDTIRSLRMGDGTDVTIPAGVTLTSNVSESSGLGWWSGNPSSLTIEGTWEFSANTGNLWLSDGFNSGPSTLIVRGNGICNVGGALLAARDDAVLIVGDNATINVPNDSILLPYYDFGAGTLHTDVTISGNPTITCGGSFGFAGNSSVTASMSGGTIDAAGWSFTTGTFTFTGGTIILDGNYEYLINESWFIAPNGASAHYDGVHTTITVSGPRVKITESGGSTEVQEGGLTDTYEVVLGEEPTANVTVTATPSDSEIDIGEGAGVPKALVFTTSNWDTAQTVTVTAFDDNVYEGGIEGDPHITIINHTSAQSGGSNEYDGISVSNVDVSVIDDDLTCGDWGYVPADFNQDCRVNLLDFAILAQEWLLD